MIKRTVLFFRWCLISIELGVLFLFLLLLIIQIKSQINPPDVLDIEVGERTQLSENYFVLGNNYLRKNEFGIWEMYIEGDSYERGLIYGKLAKELIQQQEDIFVHQIDQFVPNRIWQYCLRYLIGFFNSGIPDYIPLENQQEIYGVSRAFSDLYDFIASKYMRILNYHAAHDIGHALNDYSMVGCTSFSLKGNKTADGDMLIGRNFDFYIGDEFAKEKLLLYIAPTTGYKFVSYSWAGFTGVVSGLNEKGLSVTINAAKSNLPAGSKMPISLLARQILQYASNIEEAVSLAKKSETFVSETIMIGSSIDNKTILIEKSPNRMDVYDSNSDQVICTNHYQSNLFKFDPINLENIAESDSKIRFDKMNKLIGLTSKVDIKSAVEFLRNQNDINEDTLGMGNPSAINQLIAHHSVVIVPNKRMFYVSTSDFQMGKFIGYNIADVFVSKQLKVCDTISESNFIHSPNYKKYTEYRKIKHEITNFLLFNKDLEISKQNAEYFISLNAESYQTYELLGKFYMKKGDPKQAHEYFTMALTKKVGSLKDQKELISLMNNAQRIEE